MNLFVSTEVQNAILESSPTLTAYSAIQITVTVEQCDCRPHRALPV